MTNDQLLESVENPQNGDWLLIDTRTGLLYDGNGRAYELLSRAKAPGGAISLDTMVPVEYRTPDYSMFPDIYV